MNRNRRVIAALCAVLMACGMIAAGASLGGERNVSPQMLHVAGLEVAAWIPNHVTPGPWPIIIFSHGFHGCNTQSTFLTTALAEAGYAVFAPNHHDAACKGAGGLRAWLKRPETPFRDPQDWSDATYSDRAQDIEKLLDALSSDAQYRSPPFDSNHVGLVGHSLGGYTVLGIAGGWGRWKDPRVKAVLALSPYTNPFIVRKTLGGLGAPVMYQGGTRDIGITPFVRKSDGAYDRTPAPKYFVEFDGAGHVAWTDLRSAYQPPIVDYSRAFLDRYLKDKPFPKALAEPHQGVSAIRIKE